jgi:GTPase SAR1 family protein
MPDGHTERLTHLRRTLYECTELRAEAIEEPDRREWLVDVFAEVDDPVLEIIEKISWSSGGSTALGLAGGSGVGKTTQVYRLIDKLWEDEQIVGIRVGYEDYSSLSSPPDITDFLLSVVGGLADEARSLGRLPSDWDEESVGHRILGLLQRLRFEPEVTAGPVNIKASLREDESFRRRLREHLAGQVAQLVKEVRSFASSVVADISSHTPGCRGVVMIVDSTERLSAPASAEEEMQGAVRNLFIQNGENLRFEDLHSVYMLPPWLPISDGGALRLDTVMFPTIRVANRDGTPAESGIALLDQIVRKRMSNIHELVSESDLREMYQMCGGIQRVLFTLLKELAGRARRSTSLPIDCDVVHTALDSVRQDYLAITVESAPALRHIDETKSVDGLEEEALAQLGRYFQALVVVQVANGEKWFTIHPLMRQRLDSI